MIFTKTQQVSTGLYDKIVQLIAIERTVQYLPDIWRIMGVKHQEAN